MLLIILLSLSTAFGLQFKEQVSNFTASDGLVIKGKLTVPTAETQLKFPAVVFLHGSGASDMNLWLPGQITADGNPHKMFEVLAHHIGSDHFITYRYNKRGVTDQLQGPPIVDPNIFASGDVDALVADALSAIKMLRTNPQVDQNKIILLGLSEGTVLAPLIVKEDQNIAGMILVSLVGRNLQDILYYQFVQRNIDLVRKQIDENKDDLISNDESKKHPEAALPFDTIDTNKDNFISMSELEAVLLDQYYTEQTKNLTGPHKNWFAQHFALPPNFKNIVTFKGPILLMQGDQDLQTPLSEALLVANNLKKTGHPNYQLLTYGGLGHGLGKQGAVPTVGPIEQKPMEDMVDWLNAHFSKQ
jgi:uncharacterized protein